MAPKKDPKKDSAKKDPARKELVKKDPTNKKRAVPESAVKLAQQSFPTNYKIPKFSLLKVIVIKTATITPNSRSMSFFIWTLFINSIDYGFCIDFNIVYSEASIYRASRGILGSSRRLFEARYTEVLL